MEIFTWTPFKTPKVSDAFHVITTEFEDGPTYKNFVRRLPCKWTLTFKTTYAILTEIRDFYWARNASTEPFIWHDPYKDTYIVVRFASDGMDFETDWKINGMFEVVLEEVME